MREAWINDNAEAQLLQHISYTQSQGRDAWSIYSDCTSFATVAWAQATGESLRYLNAGGIGSPSTVADSITQFNGGHDYAFHFADSRNGYYFNDGSFGRYDSNGNGYYIWDPSAAPGAVIGQTTDGQPVYQGGGGGGSGGGGVAYGGLAGIFSGFMAPGSTIGTNFFPHWFDKAPLKRPH